MEPEKAAKAPATSAPKKAVKAVPAPKAAAEPKPAAKAPATPARSPKTAAPAAPKAPSKPDAVSKAPAKPPSGTKAPAAETAKAPRSAPGTESQPPAAAAKPAEAPEPAAPAKPAPDSKARPAQPPLRPQTADGAAKPPEAAKPPKPFKQLDAPEATPSRDWASSVWWAPEAVGGLPLGDADKELIRQAWLFFGRAGSPRGRRALLAAAAARRGRLGLSPADHLERIRRDPQEWSELWRICDLAAADSFFRWPAQFELLARLLSERAVMAPDRSMRILSAGCRRGHEAASLAMTMAATGLAGKGWKISVDGFDPSSENLKQAVDAKFTAQDLSFLEPAAARRWFEPRAGGWRLKNRLVPPLEFFQANPADLGPGPLSERGGAYDAIFCRGLAFDCPDHLVGRLPLRLLPLLAPEGILFTAPGEFWPLPPEAVVEVSAGVPYIRRTRPKAKANVFFTPRRAGARSGRARPPAPPEPDGRLEAIRSAFEEAVGSDPDAARELALEALDLESGRGLVTCGTMSLMLRVERELGRSRCASLAGDFIEAWEGEDPGGSLGGARAIEVGRDGPE
jgi:chemotaxis methyl-accepting protein methylase